VVDGGSDEVLLQEHSQVAQQLSRIVTKQPKVTRGRRKVKGGELTIGSKQAWVDPRAGTSLRLTLTLDAPDSYGVTGVLTCSGE
jgi:hypothetical protein